MKQFNEIKRLQQLAGINEIKVNKPLQIIENKNDIELILEVFNYFDDEEEGMPLVITQIVNTLGGERDNASEVLSLKYKGIYLIKELVDFNFKGLYQAKINFINESITISIGLEESGFSESGFNRFGNFMIVE
jgi:hypothetical protein